ncbi:MAG: pyruvate:ferredoxin (flavodoxin) oxidoreductase [Candidatus Woesearchaeota archaeon]
MTKRTITCDGNTAAARIGYKMSEVAAIFPITPSSPMGELADLWASQGERNIFDQIVTVQEMQSEAGASGTIHGSLSGGALTTTFTASQGLLLMLPNMYKIAGEMMPAVFHVAARSLAAQALSIYGDHSDVMGVRQSGFALLASSSIQESQDMAAIAHLASVESRVPFVHFFDGFRSSHEIQKIEALEDEELKRMTNHEAIKAFKNEGMRPERPYVKVGAQNPDVYFQGRETVNKYYDALPSIVKEYMELFAKETGRQYKLFDYVGSPEAEQIIIAMGSATGTIEEAVNHMNQNGGKVGAVRVHLYRPFSTEDLLKTIPKTVKKIAVLDRTKEPGAPGEPLYLDVLDAIKRKDRNTEEGPSPETVVIGGRYGLSSKEFTPSMVKAVFNHLSSDGWHGFTVGINDDVTHLSIPVGETINSEPEGLTQCKFWGYGSDGTVSANKNSIKIIGENTGLHVQGHFVYDSKKSGGVTISHLRFGKQPIKSEYEIQSADFIALHKPSYIGRYDILENIKEGGTFLLNSPWKPEEVFEHLTEDMQQTIKEKNIKVYTIDAFSLAEKVGLGKRINTIMETAFFKLTSILDSDTAIKAIKDHIETQFEKKGQEIVKKNWAAVDEALQAIKEVPTSQEPQASVQKQEIISDDAGEFARDIIKPIAHLKGNDIPVSKMPLNGAVPLSTSRLEKRGVATKVPEWNPETCIQCGMCSFVCPHAAIRVKQIEPENLKDAPTQFKTLNSMTKNERELAFKVQVYPEDCIGCGLCVNACPMKDKGALKMVPLKQARENGENENVEFFESLPDNVMDGVKPESIKGSQFRPTYFEFSGACAGCGETPVVKLATQLFGDRMVIANATGCSSIYGGMFPTTPYAQDKEGKGPAWANSLFEDNAEYGYGMRLAIDKNRETLKETIEKLIETGTTEKLTTALKRMLEHWDETGEEAKEAAAEVNKHLPEALEHVYGESEPLLNRINELKDYLIDKSVWLVGGDGWAYDIGFGGLDHVLAQGKNVNVLVLDNEQYANTGGQASKSTPRGATAKFAMAGRPLPKKNLGVMMTTYGNVYVAQVSMGANKQQLIKALVEAENYPGPSLVIAYATCINHGTDMSQSIQEGKLAMNSGYLQLFRYDPRRTEEGKNPMIVDSSEPSVEFKNYILNETRYRTLEITHPETAGKLFELAKQDAENRRKQLGKLAGNKE